MPTPERPRRLATLVLHDTGDDLLVHDPERAKVHVLNAAAGRILSLCDGERSVSEIVDDVAWPAEIERTKVERDVHSVLLEFKKHHLLERA